MDIKILYSDNRYIENKIKLFLFIENKKILFILISKYEVEIWC